MSLGKHINTGLSRPSKYAMYSHIDWTQEPFGKVFFVNSFCEQGLCTGAFTGTSDQIKRWVSEQGLELISAATLLSVWRDHDTNRHEIRMANREHGDKKRAEKLGELKDG